MVKKSYQFYTKYRRIKNTYDERIGKKIGEPVRMCSGGYASGAEKIIFRAFQSICL
jgi:hypothetical protein